MAKLAMRLIVCLLVSIAIGAATYTLGAVIWSVADPLGASAVLLFTIPIAIGLVTIPALVAVALLILLCIGRQPARRRKRVAPLPANVHVPPTAHQNPDDLGDLQFAA